MERNNLRMEKNVAFPAIHRVPVEIWETILEQLNPDNDYLSLCNASSIWDPILVPSRVNWMFRHIFPVIIKSLSREEVFTCREVCKQWCLAVDYFLENNVIQRPAFGENESKISYKLDFNHAGLQQYLRKEKFEYHLKKLEQQEKIVDEASIHPQNPMIGRCAAVKYHEEKERFYGLDEEVEIGIEILETIGHHLHFLCLHIPEARPLHFLNQFIQLFLTVDICNLKKLHTIKECDMGMRSQRETEIVAGQLQERVNNITDEEKSCFPRKLETLTLGRIVGFGQLKLQQIMLTFFAENLTSLILGQEQFVFPPDVQLPQLVNLQIFIQCTASLESLAELASPLRQLRVEFASASLNDAGSALLIDSINHFHSTLRNLELGIQSGVMWLMPVVEGVRPFLSVGCLHLPLIKTLTFFDYLPPSINFITDLKTLQFLYFFIKKSEILEDKLLAYCNSIVEEKVDIIERINSSVKELMYQDTPRKPNIYESNIWTNFKRLKVVEINVDQNRAQSLYWEYRRNLSKSSKFLN